MAFFTAVNYTAKCRNVFARACASRGGVMERESVDSKFVFAPKISLSQAQKHAAVGYLGAFFEVERAVSMSVLCVASCLLPLHCILLQRTLARSRRFIPLYLLILLTQTSAQQVQPWRVRHVAHAGPMTPQRAAHQLVSNVISSRCPSCLSGYDV